MNLNWVWLHPIGLEHSQHEFVLLSIFLKAQISPSTAIKSFRMNSDLWKALLINHAPKPTSSFPVRKHLLAFLRFWYLRKYRWSESTLCTCGQTHVSACFSSPLYSRGSAEFARSLKKHQILEPLWKQPAGKNKFPNEGKQATPSWALKAAKNLLENRALWLPLCLVRS